MPTTLKDEAAICGIGQTEYSKNSGRSELSLACEATLDAIRDAGLKPSDIDGMTSFTLDTTDEIEVARTLGVGDLTFFSRVPHGGGAALGVVHQAAMAVATGVPPSTSWRTGRSTAAPVRATARACRGAHHLGPDPLELVHALRV